MKLLSTKDLQSDFNSRHTRILQTAERKAAIFHKYDWNKTEGIFFVSGQYIILYLIERRNANKRMHKGKKHTWHNALYITHCARYCFLPFCIHLQGTWIMELLFYRNKPIAFLSYSFSLFSSEDNIGSLLIRYKSAERIDVFSMVKILIYFSSH